MVRQTNEGSTRDDEVPRIWEESAGVSRWDPTPSVFMEVNSTVEPYDGHCALFVEPYPCLVWDRVLSCMDKRKENAPGVLGGCGYVYHEVDQTGGFSCNSIWPSSTGNFSG